MLRLYAGNQSDTSFCLLFVNNAGLVVVTATMVVSLFKKTSVPSPIGDTVLKSSLFGMTINKGKTPSVAAPAQSKELSE